MVDDVAVADAVNLQANLEMAIIYRRTVYVAMFRIWVYASVDGGSIR